MNLSKTLIILAAMTASSTSHAEVKRALFATTPTGEAVDRFTITNRNGLTARIITWGATLTEMHVPGRDGKLADVTLGFDSPEPWLQPHPFFGSTAGRYANRIAKGRFTLDGQTFQLATSNGENHLHGGKSGFDKRNWKAEATSTNSVRLSYTSPDGEEGYPGELQITLTYTLTDADELRLDYQATTTKPTVLNLTNHAYWNLSPTAPDVLAHELTINATHYTAVDPTSIPTGELAPAAGAMDFQKAKPIGRDIAALATAPGGGFDHNWVIAGKPGQLTPAAELHDPSTGRTMRILTTEPGIQFYTGNYLKDVAGKNGRTYGKHAGLCLETQHFPDSPNQPKFPTTTLRPGETFRSTTVHAFSVR